MKKLVIVFLFITHCFSSNNNYELRLYEKIIPNLFQKDVLVYLDKNSKDTLHYSIILKSTLNCIQADVLIGKNFKNLPIECQDKPVFSTNYRTFLNTKNSIGAFYWRKGRPQIKFKLDVLNRYNLKLPKSLIEFVQ